jgi:hypothetical protein
LPKHLDLERIRDNLLGLPVNIRVDERHIVVARNHVSEMLQFLVGRGRRYEETVTISSGQTPDDTGTGDGGVDDGNDILELGLEDRVEVCR